MPHRGTTSSRGLPLRVRRHVDDRGLIVPLVLANVLILAMIAFWPDVWPVSLFVFPLMLANSFLAPRAIPWFALLTALFALASLLFESELSLRLVIRSIVIVLIALLIWRVSLRRTRLGVGGAKAEAMFVDLLERIQRPSNISLPAGWYLDTAIRAAGNTPFNGDFVVSTQGRETLQLVVVDVSGKGTQAGTRALQLSGALAGLLDALPASRFLAAANDYLLRQDWDEGFATAIHLCINLENGAYEVRSAGHLPAIQLKSGQGRWTAIPAEGPALGLVEDADYPATHGVVRPKDSMVLYTDGLVERPGEHIDVGIDRLLGQAERALAGGADDLAERLIDAPGSSDDRTLVLLHRL
ncbi:MAG: PP2C family protein-serine/threonine phosphatase [Nocardioides sp.]|jgi:hypothetical protein